MPINQIENNFTYHSPTPEEIEVYGQIRKLARGLAVYFECNLPPSRERALAMTKLEESVMWANAARARYDKDGKPKIG